MANKLPSKPIMSHNINNIHRNRAKYNDYVIIAISNKLDNVHENYSWK